MNEHPLNLSCVLHLSSLSCTISTAKDVKGNIKAEPSIIKDVKLLVSNDCRFACDVVLGQADIDAFIY